MCAGRAFDHEIGRRLSARIQPRSSSVSDARKGGSALESRYRTQTPDEHLPHARFTPFPPVDEQRRACVLRGAGQWCSGYPGTKKQSSANGGATGWLTSTAPVQAGETFTLEFMIWDTGDPFLDSSVLIDNFTWVEGQVAVSTGRPPS